MKIVYKINFEELLFHNRIMGYGIGALFGCYFYLYKNKKSIAIQE